jgi:hypothetical protein
MMVTLGKYNWWPRKMPPITKSGPFGGPTSSSINDFGTGVSIPMGLVEGSDDRQTAAALLEDDFNAL